MKKIFSADVKEGKTIWHDPIGVVEHIKTLEEQKIKVTIEKWRKPRSNEENKYYWGVVIDLLCDHTGYTPDEMHDALRWMFLRKEGEDPRVPTIISTSELSTMDFETYLSKIRSWASRDLQLYIPKPNESINKFENY